MNQHLLSIKNLSVTFHTKGRATYALRNLNLTLDKGKKLGLVGESGSGKSVMSRSVLRLLAAPPARISGEIFLENEELLSKKEEEMRHIRGNRISMVFQEPMVSLNPLFTIQSQLAEVVRTHQKLPNEELHELLVQSLTEVGIAQPERCLRQYPHALSGGMRQRVMIAMALLCKPEILIADEPTTALDVTIQAQILDLLNEVNQKYGTSIILITHDLGVVAETADTVAVMYAGEIVELSDVRDIFRHPLHPYTQGLLQSIPSLEDEKEELQAIEGTAPSLHELPKGCAFCGRCPYARPLCNAGPPPEVRLGDRLVRCFQYSGQW